MDSLNIGVTSLHKYPALSFTILFIIPLKHNITFLTPSRTPRVLDEPVVLLTVPRGEGGVFIGNVRTVTDGEDAVVQTRPAGSVEDL